MATTFIDYTGDGNATKQFSFPSYQVEDVKVEVDGVVKTVSTHYNITSYTTTGGGNVVFTSGNIPVSPQAIRIYRDTDIQTDTGEAEPKETFQAGSSVKAAALNNNQKQVLYAIAEEKDQTITAQDIKDGAITSAKITDGTLVNADINASAAIAGTKISPDFGSQNIATTGTVNGVSTTELAILDGATVSTAELNILDGVTATASELNILDGVTATATELNALDGITSTTTELNYVDGVTSNVQTQLDGKQPLDAELTELATMGSGTAGALADLNTAEVQTLDGITASTSELNLLDGKSIVTTIGNSATDVQLPSAQAVNERIVELVTEVGGFAPIANETSFPATNPDINDGAGTIVSVKALASNLVANGSGVATIANGAGSGNTVTINGLTAGSTIAAGLGILVETTSTLHTYTFHRTNIDATGVSNAQTLVSDFNDRYQVSGSAPSNHPDGSALGDGDLWFDTSANVMKVYDLGNTQYNTVASVGDFKLLTVVPDGATSGSPTFDGNIVSYDLRDAGNAASITNVGQLFVSLNGVIQKPNAGSYNASNEGFYLEGTNGIKFCTAPVSGSSLFVTQIGAATGVGTPSDNTVSEAKLQSDSVSEAKLKVSNTPTDGKFLQYKDNTDQLTWATVATPDSDKILEGNAKVEVKRTSDSPQTGDHTDEVEFTVSKTDASNSGNNLTHIAGTVDGHGRWFIGPQSGGKSSAPDHLTDGSALTISGSYDRADNVSGSYNSYACLHLNNASPQSASALGKIYFSGYGNGFEGGSIIGIPTGAWGNFPNYRATDITVNLNGYGVNSSTDTSLVERWRFKASGALAVNGISNIGTAGQVLTSQGDQPPTWEDGSAVVADGCIYENSQTISNNYTISTNKNAMSAGPITIASNVTVTVPSGSTYTIV